jgi:hypothetical protein
VLIISNLSNNGDNIHISGTQGDVIGAKVTGAGNIVGKDIVISGTINIGTLGLEKIPSEYSKALKDFSENINQQSISNKIAKQQVEPIESEIKEIAKDMENIKNVESVSPTERRILNGKFANVIEKVLKVLPKTAEIITTFTPLSPFSRIIGESIEKVVIEIQKSL